MYTRQVVHVTAILGALAAGATASPLSAVAQEPAPIEPIEVRLAVSNFATNATAAHAASGLTVQRVMRAIAQSGVQVDAVESGPMHIVPEYARPDPIPIRGVREDPRIIGYRAIGEIIVRTRDVARIGHLLDMARGAGANELRPAQLP